MVLLSLVFVLPYQRRYLYAINTGKVLLLFLYAFRNEVDGSNNVNGDNGDKKKKKSNVVVCITSIYL